MQALLTIGAVLLTADFAASRFPSPGWRMAAAVTVALCTGLNDMVFLYAPLAQPYGICLFTLVLAFRIYRRRPCVIRPSYIPFDGMDNGPLVGCGGSGLPGKGGPFGGGGGSAKAGCSAAGSILNTTPDPAAPPEAVVP